MRSNIRLLGFLVALLAIAVMHIFIMNRGMSAKGGHDLGMALWLSVYLFIVAVPMLIGSAYASLLFTVPCAVFGLWLCIGSVINVPMPWAFINVLMGVGLFAPLYISIHAIRALE
ncbi:MAG: hypothetical protein K9N51_11000 [Candidatus Pacebacteria bacterium]|nr:hypothetical protein [Candidatus Paceibacterota bacterium]